MISISFLILLLTFVSEIFGKVFEFPTIVIEQGICFSLEAGTPLTSQFFNLNLGYSHVWIKINKKEFLGRQSEALGFANLTMYYNVLFKALKTIETIDMSKEPNVQTKVPLLMYLVETTNENWYVVNGIGLSPNADEKLNLLYQLEENKLIEKKNFAIVNFNYKFGKVFLGDIEPKNYIDYNSSMKIFVDKSYNTWGTHLNKIVISGKEIYNKRHYAYFQTNQTYISVPIEILDHLKETVFAEYIEKKQCEAFFHVKRKFFSCKKEVAENFPNVFFYFDQGILELPSKEVLFEYSGPEKIKFLIVGDSSLDEYIIGSRIFNCFLTVFDYDDSSINFYQTQDYWKKLEKLNKNIIKLLYVTSIGLCSINIIVVIFFKFQFF